MKGNITRRGKNSWRLKFDVGYDAKGNRKIRYETVRGVRKDAERELNKRLNDHHDGTSVDPSKTTLAEYTRAWLETAEVSPKTLERYKQLAEQQIIPHLGATVLQKLRPAQVQEWHDTLKRSGGNDGQALSARTVGHAHRVLHRVLARAAAAEVVSRNVATSIRPPKVETAEVKILLPEEIGLVLRKLQGHALYPIVSLALATGMRRGELLGLQWGDVNFDKATLRVERSVEETKSGMRLKQPKTKHGRRTISLPPSAIEVLKDHRQTERKKRIALGLGREAANTLLFSTIEGEPLSPDNLSRDWRRTVLAKKLPAVMFHALRHSHASALIAGGLDVLTVSRRLGHGSPAVTLTVYAHLFEKTDLAAATAIEASLKRRTSEP
jgi:integrase